MEKPVSRLMYSRCLVISVPFLYFFGEYPLFFAKTNVFSKSILYPVVGWCSATADSTYFSPVHLSCSLSRVPKLLSVSP